MTQATLSEAIDRKKSVISNYESGISEPSMETLIMLADFFKVSMSDLISFDLEEHRGNSSNTEQIGVSPLAGTPVLTALAA